MFTVSSRVGNDLSKGTDGGGEERSHNKEKRRRRLPGRFERIDANSDKLFKKERSMNG